MRLAGRIARDGLLRHGQGGRIDGARYPGAQVHAGQELAIGIGHLDPEGEAARSGIHRRVGEQDLAGELVELASDRRDVDGERADMLAATARDHVLQRLATDRGLADIEIDAIELLDDGEAPPCRRPRQAPLRW